MGNVNGEERMLSGFPVALLGCIRSADRLADTPQEPVTVSIA